MLLFTKDQTRAASVGPDVLSVHMLRPYQRPEAPEESGWDEFHPRIVTALKAYWHVADPEGVRRISVRHINRIVILEPMVKIEDYLHSAVPLVQGLPDAVNDFMSRTDYRCEDGAHLVLAQGTFTPPSGEIGFLLDIEVNWERADLLTETEALARTDRLRALERNAFEAVITDVARELSMLTKTRPRLAQPPSRAVDRVLQSDGQRIRLRRGRTPVPGLSERHVDVCHLDYCRLGRIGDRIATAIRQDQWRRFRQREIVTLLVSAIRNGRLSETDLTEKLQAKTAGGAVVRGGWKATPEPGHRPSSTTVTAPWGAPVRESGNRRAGDTGEAGWSSATVARR